MKTQEEKLNIIYVARDDHGCGFYRCEQPAEFLSRSGIANAISVLRTPTQNQLIHADLVIMQEMGSVEANAMVNFMEENRIPFMVEFDDFIHHISPRNKGGYIAWNPSTLYVYRAMEISKRAFGMTVATGQLAREYFPYNDFIYVLPNYLDKDIWDVPIMRRQDDKIRIGWAGGNAHADDLHMVSKVIDRIVKEYDGKVIFETMGMTRQELAGVFPMEHSTENSCPSCGYEGTLHHFPAESYRTYPQVLGSRGWDIVIAPVIDNAFGNAKSDLKLKEYSALGYPVIASDVRSYRDAKRDGAPVTLVDTYEEWYIAIKKLIEDKELRDDISRKAKDWAEKNWIQDHVKDIYEIYWEVIARANAMIGDKKSRLKALKVV